MKKIVITMMAIAFLTACQESLEDRCAREAKSYTEKKCPAPVGDNTTIDSIGFDKATHTMLYYYTLSGAADDAEAVASVNPRANLLQEIKNSTSIKAYKDAGYNFKYIYRSQKNPQTILFETTFTKKDY